MATYYASVRIVQASKAYWPHVGGIETVVQQLAEGFHRRGIESSVVVAADDRHGQASSTNGVRVVRSATYGRMRSVPISPSFPIKLLKQRGDALLIHEPSVLPELTLALTSPLVRRNFSTIGLWWHSDIVRQQVLLKFFGPALRRALSLVDVIFTATPAHLSSSEMLGPFAEKVTFVPYGLNLQRFVSDPLIEHRAEEWRSLLGKKIVLFVGRLVYYKGIEELIRAANYLPDAHFIIVGTGEKAQFIDESQAMKAGRITLLNFVDDDELRSLLRAADVFVLPSVANTEAFGIVQAEAMASGTPVVTFDLPTGVTWVNRHEETGLVAVLGHPDSLSRAIDRLLTDETLRAKLGARAKSRAHELFDEETMCNSVVRALSRSGASTGDNSV